MNFLEIIKPEKIETYARDFTTLNETTQNKNIFKIINLSIDHHSFKNVRHIIKTSRIFQRCQKNKNK